MKKIFTIALLISTLRSWAQSDSTGGNQEKGDRDTPLTFNAYAEGYYSYDFNKPNDNNRPAFLYSHNRHNEFNINIAMIRGTYTGERTRANLALAAGTYMNANYASEPGVLKNIFEANIGYRLSRKKNLWLDLGILPSHIGWESAISKDCWTVTRSIAADNSPYYEGGARITYTTDNGKWLVGGYALNGWQRITRPGSNSLISWGTQIQFRPNEKVMINYSTFIGTDSPDSVRTWRYFHDVYAVLQFTKVIGLTLGFDEGMQQQQKNSKATYNWFTPVGILRISPADKWAIAFRGEYYEDAHGVIIYTGTAHGFKTTGYSVNIDYLPMKNMAIRVEGRTLHSKDAIFVKSGTALQQNNTALTFSMALSF